MSARIESTVAVEITDSGDLRLSASVAARYFPGDALVASWHDDALWLIPLVGPTSGGLLLKQRNLAGDRSTLIWEHIPPATAPGRYPASWDGAAGGLRVAVGA